MPSRLTNIALGFVSLVDRGAHQDADVVLFKRDAGEDGEPFVKASPGSGSVHVDTPMGGECDHEYRGPKCRKCGAKKPLSIVKGSDLTKRIGQPPKFTPGKAPARVKRVGPKRMKGDGDGDGIPYENDRRKPKGRKGPAAKASAPKANVKAVTKPTTRGKPSGKTEAVRSPQEVTQGHKHSKDLHQANGRYTDERITTVHTPIIRGLVDGVPKSEDSTVFLMGGGPAAGKSSIIKSGGVKVPGGKKAVQVNADDIKDQLPEYEELRGQRWEQAAEFAHEESSELSKAAMEAAYAQGSDIVLDGTGNSSLDSLKGKIGKMRAKGYKVKAHYVTIPTEEAVTRSRARGEKEGPDGGRFVPDHVVRDTHQSVSAIFPDAVAAGLFDEVTLWDNDGPPGSPPTLVASGVGTELTVHDEALYKKFLAKATPVKKADAKGIPDGGIPDIPFEWPEQDYPDIKRLLASMKKGTPMKPSKDDLRKAFTEDGDLTKVFDFPVRTKPIAPSKPRRRRGVKGDGDGDGIPYESKRKVGNPDGGAFGRYKDQYRYDTPTELRNLLEFKGRAKPGDHLRLRGVRVTYEGPDRYSVGGVPLSSFDVANFAATGALPESKALQHITKGYSLREEFLKAGTVRRIGPKVKGDGDGDGIPYESKRKGSGHTGDDGPMFDPPSRAAVKRTQDRERARHAKGDIPTVGRPVKSGVTQRQDVTFNGDKAPGASWINNLDAWDGEGRDALGRTWGASYNGQLQHGMASRTQALDWVVAQHRKWQASVKKSDDTTNPPTSRTLTHMPTTEGNIVPQIDLTKMDHEDLVAYAESLEEALTKADDSDDGSTDELTLDDVLKSADPATQAIVKRLADDAEAARNEAETATNIAKAERDARLDQEFIAKAETLSHLGATPEEMTSVIKSLHATGSTETYTAVMDLLAKADAAVAAGGLFTELGADTPTSTVGGDIEGIAKGLREADPTLTEAQAIAKALDSDPNLYSDYLNQGA